MPKVKELRRQFVNRQIAFKDFQRMLAMFNIDLTNVEGMFTRACSWTTLKTEVKKVLVTTE